MSYSDGSRCRTFAFCAWIAALVISAASGLDARPIQKSGDNCASVTPITPLGGIAGVLSSARRGAAKQSRRARARENRKRMIITSKDRQYEHRRSPPASRASPAPECAPRGRQRIGDSRIIVAKHKLLTAVCKRVTQRTGTERVEEPVAMRSRIAAAASRVRHGAALYAAALWVLGCGLSLAQVTAPEPLASVIRMIDAGQFKAANAAIDGALTQTNDPAQKTALQFQRERMRRILMDFDQGADELKAQIRKQIPDLTDEEFARWSARGYIEHREIDGRTLYFNRAASNLFRLSADARGRRVNPQPFDDSPLQTASAYHAKVIHAALETHRTSVLPQRVRVTQSLTVK